MRKLWPWRVLLTGFSGTDKLGQPLLVDCTIDVVRQKDDEPLSGLQRWRGHFVWSARGSEKNANWQLEPDISETAVAHRAFPVGRAETA